jgi:hypothetical protein
MVLELRFWITPIVLLLSFSAFFKATSPSRHSSQYHSQPFKYCLFRISTFWICEHTKHIKIDCHFICYHLLHNSLLLHSVTSQDQLADLFTKSHSKDIFAIIYATYINVSHFTLSLKQIVRIVPALLYYIVLLLLRHYIEKPLAGVSLINWLGMLRYSFIVYILIMLGIFERMLTQQPI